MDLIISGKVASDSEVVFHNHLPAGGRRIKIRHRLEFRFRNWAELRGGQSVQCGCLILWLASPDLQIHDYLRVLYAYPL
jgi:hypothetical protein